MLSRPEFDTMTLGGGGDTTHDTQLPSLPRRVKGKMASASAPALAGFPTQAR
jgi:hypothetical protein